MILVKIITFLNKLNTIKQNYFRTKGVITNKASEKTKHKSKYEKYFTDGNRLQVSKNFDIINPDA